MRARVAHRLRVVRVVRARGREHQALVEEVHLIIVIGIVIVVIIIVARRRVVNIVVRRGQIAAGRTRRRWARATVTRDPRRRDARAPGRRESTPPRMPQVHIPRVREPRHTTTRVADTRARRPRRRPAASFTRCVRRWRARRPRRRPAVSFARWVRRCACAGRDAALRRTLRGAFADGARAGRDAAPRFRSDAGSGDLECVITETEWNGPGARRPRARTRGCGTCGRARASGARRTWRARRALVVFGGCPAAVVGVPLLVHGAHRR